MIFLGRKYKFAEFENEILNKKFSHIHTIVYRNREESEVLDELKNNLQHGKAKLLVINTYAELTDAVVTLLTNLKASKNLQIMQIEEFLEIYLKKCFVPQVGELTDLKFLRGIRGFNALQMAQKVAIDWLFCLPMLVLSLPLWVVSACKIRAQSPGKIFFKQLRVGKNNKEFECLKFRSMREDAEKDGAQFASVNDDRVFAWGEKMRKTRIDELPQFLNVLKGDMHLVGPRPERLFWTQQFEKQISAYASRHEVRPGITGWAQVKYPYGANVEDARQKLMYDLYYIKHWSIFLELHIIYKTAKVIIGKEGR